MVNFLMLVNFELVCELMSTLNVPLVLKLCWTVMYCRVVTAGRQLARSFELQSLNDLGFSKRYVRCLQACVKVLLTRLETFILAFRFLMLICV